MYGLNLFFAVVMLLAPALTALGIAASFRLESLVSTLLVA